MYLFSCFKGQFGAKDLHFVSISDSRVLPRAVLNRLNRKQQSSQITLTGVSILKYQYNKQAAFFSSFYST